MKTVITAKLKLNTTKEQGAHLRAMQLAYRDALNFVSQYAFAHGKMSNKVALQDGTYNEIRTRFHLPSQMACSVPRQVGATYKGLWTKVKQNALDRKSGRTKKRYKGLDQAPKYVSPTLTYQYKKDYSFRQGHEVSILTLAGRLHVPYTGYQKHLDLIEKEAEIGAAHLWYDKPHKQFYLLVSLSIEVRDPEPEHHKQIIGVDVGVRYLAVTATTRGESAFHTGKKVVPKANHSARLRKRLQKKGTRSATRRLRAISGRERRLCPPNGGLKADANHVVSTRIVTAHPHSLIGLEDLTDIREHTGRR
jgi:putative transposase